MNAVRSNSVTTAFTRVVQNAAAATTQPRKKRSAAPRRRLGTNSATFHHCVSNRAWNVMATTASAGKSPNAVNVFQVRFSTTE